MDEPFGWMLWVEICLVAFGNVCIAYTLRSVVRTADDLQDRVAALEAERADA